MLGLVWLLLFVGACAVVVIGLNYLTQATLGVGIVAVGCFLAVCARLVQAARYQGQVLKKLTPPISSAPAPAPIPAIEPQEARA